MKLVCCKAERYTKKKKESPVLMKNGGKMFFCVNVKGLLPLRFSGRIRQLRGSS